MIASGLQKTGEEFWDDPLAAAVVEHQAPPKRLAVLRLHGIDDGRGFEVGPIKKQLLEPLNRLDPLAQALKHGGMLRVPASEHATCPCAVLGLSRNQGRSFSYRVLRNVGVPPVGQGPRPTNGLSRIAIDGTRAGRIALLQADGPNESVSVSEDWGATWGPFVPAGTAPGSVATTKQAFEFSRGGVLGLMWRAIYPDQSYDIWASISRDGGRSFSRSQRISHARSPAFDPLRNGGRFGDDIQDFSMDASNMHLVWGDSRAGFQGVFYGRVRLSDF